MAGVAAEARFKVVMPGKGDTPFGIPIPLLNGV